MDIIVRMLTSYNVCIKFIFNTKVHWRLSFQAVALTESSRKQQFWSITVNYNSWKEKLGFLKDTHSHVHTEYYSNQGANEIPDQDEDAHSRSFRNESRWDQY